VSVSNTLKERALRLLAVRDHTEAELTKKLSRHAGADEVREVLADLKSLGYLDDQELACRRALYLRRQKLRGTRRIAQDLQRIGLDATMIRFALGRLEEEAPEAASLREVLNSRVARTGDPKCRADLKKLFDYAVRQGYSPSAVRKELGPFFAALEDEEA